jgi:hypothetical protein
MLWRVGEAGVLAAALPPPSEHHRGLVARAVAASHSKEGGATEGDIRAGEPRRRKESAGEHRSIQTERRLRALQPRRRPTLACVLS